MTEETTYTTDLVALDPAEEFEELRRQGPRRSLAQQSRMDELERILDARDAQNCTCPPGSWGRVMGMHPRRCAARNPIKRDAEGDEK